VAAGAGIRRAVLLDVSTACEVLTRLRPLMHWLLEPSARRRAAVILTILGGAPIVASCYSTGNGTLPPPESFYFPVGLAVSKGGNVLYAANSDFDLQWNGGTIQSYDLEQIRADAALLAVDPTAPSVAKNFVHQPGPKVGQCPTNPLVVWADGSGRVPLGQTCAPPVNSYVYVRDSAIIGAFATDIQLSPTGNRFYVPVRGDASLTWGDVAVDDPAVAPAPGDTAKTYAPFAINCGIRVEGRCDAAHHAGVDPDEPGNTRHVVLPGEPFAMAQTADGTALVVTHQSEPDVSLFRTGLDASGTPDALVGSPSLQFVISNTGQGALPFGGDGIALIPHDNLAFGCPPGQPLTSPPCASQPPLPAFIETNNTTAQLNVLRYYSDDGSSLDRPYITDESAVPLTVNFPGTDWRGVAIDPSDRIVCEAQFPWPDARSVECAQQKPAQLYLGSRTPPSLVIGSVGQVNPNGDAAYDADSVAAYQNIPLLPGVSRVYVAPIVNQAGNYERRVFIVAFDSNEIFVYNPATQIIDQIFVGNGPFAMAFDPFTLEDMALQNPVPGDPRHPDATGSAEPLELKTYRFAYVSSFTNSFVQVIDLDDSRADKSTFETVVFTLGNPTIPKGTQQND
jgi:hypothetical protein